MVSVKESELCEQNVFSRWFAQVLNGEPVLISGDQDKKAVMIPMDEFDDFKRWKEKMEYLAELDRRFEDVKNGGVVVKKTIEELEAMENE
ncbi:MAG: type II toxin-antitoxin system Phd/YefM family antitoxin [Lachnospiraceae bacterium]|nr:type II toxin-antitoxin system Phd/YefM family antitoxin [Lachnospiraceae bacterium]